MASSAASSPTLLQAVCRYYGLALAPLGACLGVPEALMKQAASGRRDLPTAAYLRLRPLADARPPPWNPAPVTAPPDAPAPPADPEAAPPPLAGPLPHPPDAAALRARRATCRHLALRLARELAPLAARQAQARHLLAVLPALAAAWLPAPTEPAARWLPLFAAQARQRLGPAATAALALRQLRRAALLAEAAQLAAWLAE